MALASSSRPRRLITAPRRLPPLRAWAVYALLAVGAVIMLGPFYVMFVYASHTQSAILSAPPPLWFGGALSDNLNRLLESTPFVRNLWNSFYIAILSTVLTLFFASLGGFGFAMYNFRFREGLFNLLLASMMIPGFLSLVPYYLMMQGFGWIDRPIALYLPGAASAFGIFLMRQYIGSAIPRELVEAARIDGASEFTIYRRLILPLSRPALSTLGLVTFIGAWNNFQGALVILQSQETNTVQLALRGLQGTISTDWGAMMAGTALAVLPLLVIFILASRQLIDGLTAGSLKG